jgi:hypothetical protein
VEAEKLGLGLQRDGYVFLHSIAEVSNCEPHVAKKLFSFYIVFLGEGNKNI